MDDESADGGNGNQLARSNEQMNAVMAAKGPEFMLGMDIPRVWATGAQSLLSPEFGMLVFREQNFMQVEGQPHAATVKNVGSIIMPINVLREFHRQLGEALAKLG